MLPALEELKEDFMWLLDYWWLAIPGVLLGIYAQVKLSSTYNRYARVPTAGGLTGAEAARSILDNAGLSNVPVGEVPGHLTDHYDPRKRELYLSSENYHSNSVAAVGVAAHESGHALQHKAAYAPLHLRMAMVPITQIATVAWQGIFLLGILFNMFGRFLGIAIAIFVVLTVFQLVTLPVEYDASRRAKARLVELGLVRGEEARGVSKVLNAAAWTYVAAMVTSVLTLLRFLMLARNREE
jgi:Zn-dependent membrane protease YugP